MRISESQLRRVVKRLVNEVSFKDPKDMLRHQAKQFMQEFQKGYQHDFQPGFPTPMGNIVHNMTMGATIGQYSHHDIIAALVEAGFEPKDARAVTMYLMNHPGGSYKKLDPWSVV